MNVPNEHRQSREWETAFLTAWLVVPVRIRDQRAGRMDHCIQLADDAVQALREARGTPHPHEEQLPAHVGTDIPKRLASVMRSFHRLSHAALQGTRVQVDFYRTQVLRELDAIDLIDGQIIARDRLMAALLDTITAAFVVELEVLVFGRPLPPVSVPPSDGSSIPPPKQ
jgi:hypothetical protein